jgi:hypothetical protein
MATDETGMHGKEKVRPYKRPADVQGVPAGPGRPGHIFVHPTDWYQAHDVTIKLDWRLGQPDSRLSPDHSRRLLAAAEYP